MNWTLDTEQDRLEVTNSAQLRQRLRELHDLARQKPVIATLNAPDGSCLTIGLGRDLSALNYIAAGGWPAQHVVGNEAAEGFVDYMCFGSYSEIPAKYAVSIATAIDAAVDYFTSGKPTEKLRWEND